MTELESANAQPTVEEVATVQQSITDAEIDLCRHKHEDRVAEVRAASLRDQVQAELQCLCALKKRLGNRICAHQLEFPRTDNIENADPLLSETTELHGWRIVDDAVLNQAQELSESILELDRLVRAPLNLARKMRKMGDDAAADAAMEQYETIVGSEQPKIAERFESLRETLLAAIDEWMQQQSGQQLVENSQRGGYQTGHQMTEYEEAA